MVVFWRVSCATGTWDYRRTSQVENFGLDILRQVASHRIHSIAWQYHMGIPFRKHRGLLLERVLLTQPDYIAWILNVQEKDRIFHRLWQEACRLGNKASTIQGLSLPHVELRFSNKSTR
jgi:hypothetical protein